MFPTLMFIPEAQDKKTKCIYCERYACMDYTSMECFEVWHALRVAREQVEEDGV